MARNFFSKFGLFFVRIVTGLERVAEELMGRRKWKLYQELARSNLNTNTATNINQQLNNIETGNISQIIVFSFAYSILHEKFIFVLFAWIFFYCKTC